jgi:hypothetical protein
VKERINTTLTNTSQHLYIAKRGMCDCVADDFC